MKKQSSENKTVITEEFIFDQNKLSKIGLITLNLNFNVTEECSGSVIECST